MGSSRIPVVAASLFSAVTLAVSPARAADPPIVTPGSELGFTVPDAVGEQSVEFGSISVMNPTDTVLGALFTAGLPNARGSCEVFRYNDFGVEGVFFHSDVSGWITGHVDVIGVLQMLGAGEVGIEVVMEVIDLGTDPAAPAPVRIVSVHPLSTLDLETSWDPDAGAAVTVEAGSATLLQPGVELGAGVSVPLRRRVVRDFVDFGFAAPLQRGHLYRLQLKAILAGRLDTRGGLAKASFYWGSLGLADAADPIFDPEFWSANMNLPFLKNFVPNVKPSTQLDMVNLFHFPELKAPEDVPSWGGYVFFPGANIKLVSEQVDFHDALEAISFPKTIPELLDSPKLGFGVDVALDESILNSGVQLSNLAIRVANDPIEDEMRLLVERNLARENQKSPIASFQLPVAHGGKLEFARKVIGELVESYSTAGADNKSMNKALAELELGDKKYAHGKWKEAYAKYRRAYDELSR